MYKKIDIYKENINGKNMYDKLVMFKCLILRKILN